MFETIRFVIQILPLIIDITTKLEEQFPQSGLGQMKRSLIIDSIRSALNSEEYLPLVEKIIGVVVSLFNKSGIFNK